MYLFCISYKQIVATIKVPTLVEYVVEQVVLKKTSSVFFCLPISGLFHRWSTSIYSFICHWQCVSSATYSVVNTNTADISYIHNCKTGFRIMRSPNVTANRKMTNSSWGINCTCQRQSCVYLASCDRKKSEWFTMNVQSVHRFLDYGTTLQYITNGIQA